MTSLPMWKGGREDDTADCLSRTCFTESPSERTMIVPLPTLRENTGPYCRAHLVNLSQPVVTHLRGTGAYCRKLLSKGIWWMFPRMGRVGGPGGSRDPRLPDNSSRTTTYASTASEVHFTAVATSSGCERSGMSIVVEAIGTQRMEKRRCLWGEGHI